MKLKELYKIYKLIRHKEGCIVICRLTDDKSVMQARLCGNFTAKELDKYTVGFNHV